MIPITCATAAVAGNPALMFVNDTEASSCKAPVLDSRTKRRHDLTENMDSYRVEPGPFSPA
jgi:hypothetical protein